ncbi:MAG: DNA methyltransferase [Planctomycetota bacterium]
MTPQQFIAKWQRVTLTERSACQQHFLDLCELLDQPKPAEADPEGTWYTFEKGVQTSEDRQGWADVWMRDHFGWEYKGKHKDLKAAYTQLQLYREALENPPLMIVCDMDRFEVHTNFTGTLKQQHLFDLAGLADPANLDILRRVFTDPNSLKPGITSEAITIEAAERFAKLADGMRDRGIEPLRAAHFLMKLMFCMFGEDTLLLPAGLFGKLLDNAKANPAYLPRRLESLFKAMASGGDYGNDTIAWFNGGLFADADVISLTQEEINSLVVVNGKDWSCVEPSIFGTLFQRTLDPAKRSQIGAHFTGRADIEDLLKPVLLAPLQREWAEVKRKCEEELWPKVVKASRARTKGLSDKDSPQRKAFDRAILDFIGRLAQVSVLDPACGSGNFLYVALHMLLDLEKEVIAYAAMRGLSLVPQVNPAQLRGLEINVYAHQLAQIVIWIGYLQWMHHNGFKMPNDPVLAPIDTIKQMDAILDLSDPEHPKEPEWPEAEFIVGNPPFLGGKLLRKNLGDDYVDAMFKVWGERVPREADLCCYWFERARAHIENKKCRRAGLLATQGIRGGANRKILERIKVSGDIFFAESDRKWVLDGAAVHISMAGFDGGEEKSHVLDGKPVVKIHADLSAAANTATAKVIAVNRGISFMGDTKGGAFDIADAIALEMLKHPNPHGRPNSDVVVPWINGLDVSRRNRDMWIIDFGVEMESEKASRYESPFDYICQNVRPEREKNNRQSYRDRWWIHVEPRPALRKAFASTCRFIGTTTVSKYRLFAWFEAPVLPDHALIVFAQAKDCFFGILHSRIHETWALQQGTQLETRPRYTPSSCFETFPFPQPTPYQDDAISCAAKELDDLRCRWLNPPEWTKTEVLEFPGSVDGPWARYVVDPDARGIGTVRWPRLIPKDTDCAASLKTRTLTNLYNQRPAWLDLTHMKLDTALFAAYGWDPGISDDELLERLLKLNLERAEKG